MNKYAKDFIDLEQFFNSFKFTTFHRLLNEEDTNGKILVVKGTDKPLFWLLINQVEQDYQNVKFWISGSFKSTDNLYVLIRIIDPKIIKNKNLMEEISGQSYNEIIEFGRNHEFLDREYEKLKNEVKEKEKKKRNKRKTN